MFYVGGSNSLELKGITSDYNYPSDSDGKSMKLGKKNSNTSTGRFKLVNSLVKNVISFLLVNLAILFSLKVEVNSVLFLFSIP